MCTFAVLSLMISCSGKENDEPGEKIPPAVSLNVTVGEDGSARIEVAIVSGRLLSAKIVESYPVKDIFIDYNVEIRLVQFVEEQGAAIPLPHSKTLTEGLRPGSDYLTAVIAYDETGRAACSAFRTWKAKGQEGTWSNNNSAGELEDNVW